MSSKFPRSHPTEHLWDVVDEQVGSMDVPPHNLQDLKDLLPTDTTALLQGCMESMTLGQSCLGSKRDQHNIRQVVIVCVRVCVCVCETRRSSGESLRCATSCVLSQQLCVSAHVV